MAWRWIESSVARGVREFAAECLGQEAVKLWQVPASEALCFSNWNWPEDLSEDHSQMEKAAQPRHFYARHRND